MLRSFLLKFLLVSGISSVVAAPPLKDEFPVVPSVIIGGGVGGGTAAIYLARAGFKPLVLQGSSPGGALAQSHSVENWPGEQRIEGEQLMERIRSQAEVNGALYVQEEVIGIDFSKRPFTITTKSVIDPSSVRTIRAASCIIATGSSPNVLGIPGEKEYWGRGVSSCAICDGSLYKGKRVGVVGGGDSAVLEAMYLANIAKEVSLFVRKDYLRATDEQRKAALLAMPNVKIFYETTVEAVKGSGGALKFVKLRKGSKTQEFSLDGLFLAIGAKPNTELFKGKIALNAQGYVSLQDGQETSIPYVYAVGDVSDPLYKQAISAAGEGARAALSLQSKLTDAAQLVAAYQQALNRPVVLQHKVVEITSLEQFHRELKNDGMPVLVDFYAKWCAPCKRIAPRLDSCAAQLAGKVKFLKVDVDLLGELTHNYQIQSMPTVLYFDEAGTVIERKVGTAEINALLAQLESE